MSRRVMPCREKPCPQCPFARTTSKDYLDTMGDNGERFVGQAAGPFTLPCHMQQNFQQWSVNPRECIACAGAAIYRGNIGYKGHPSLPVMPPDHVTVFSTPEELLAHHRGISLHEATEKLAETTPEEWTRVELHKAHIITVPRTQPN